MSLMLTGNACTTSSAWACVCTSTAINWPPSAHGQSTTATQSAGWPHSTGLLTSSDQWPERNEHYLTGTSRRGGVNCSVCLCSVVPPRGAARRNTLQLWGCVFRCPPCVTTACRAVPGLSTVCGPCTDLSAWGTIYATAPLTAALTDSSTDSRLHCTHSSSLDLVQWTVSTVCWCNTAQNEG